MGVSIFNTGYDLQDQIDAAESAIAIVSIGDTHVAITSGQYVYVREHGTLAEGLYRATANIAANATLSGSNVTAVSGGGLNALNSKIAPIAEPLTDAVSNFPLGLSVFYTTNHGVFPYNSTIFTASCGGNRTFQFAIDANNGKISLRKHLNDNGWSQWQELALNSNMNPYMTKYIRGRIDVSSGSPSTPLGRVQNFISGVTTENKYVSFDVMLSYQGSHYFVGYLYPDKDYGDGIYIEVDGKAYKWTRLNNVDSLEELALNSKITGSSEFTLTAGTGFSILSEVNNKMGSICAISVRVKATQVFNANSIVLTVPAGYKPVSTTTSLKTQQKRGNNEYNNIGYATIDTNGNLKQTLTSGGAVDDEMEFLFIYNTI